jgi:hypothetical protein
MMRSISRKCKTQGPTRLLCFVHALILLGYMQTGGAPPTSSVAALGRTWPNLTSLNSTVATDYRSTSAIVASHSHQHPLITLTSIISTATVGPSGDGRMGGRLGQLELERAHLGWGREGQRHGR